MLLFCYCCLLLLLRYIMLCSVVQCIGNIILTYVVLLLEPLHAWLRDCILVCIVPLFHCSLIERIAVHERLFSQVVERAELYNHIAISTNVCRYPWLYRKSRNSRRRTILLWMQGHVRIQVLHINGVQHFIVKWGLWPSCVWSLVAEAERWVHYTGRQGDCTQHNTFLPLIL